MSEAERSEPVYCAAGIQIMRSADLAAAGWERRTVGDPERMAELIDLYVSLGYETTTTELDPSSFGEACTSCAITACTSYVALYTRRQNAG